MKFYKIIIYLLVSPTILFAQESIDNKYLMAILHLKCNERAISEIKYTFRIKKNKNIEFNISNRVEFIPIQYFDNQLLGEKYNIITNRALYRDKYYCPPYENNLLGHILEKTNTNLLLTFSKSIDNYLIAEILDTSISISPEIKMGYAIQFLFFFDEYGLIEKVLHERCVYN